MDYICNLLHFYSSKKDFDINLNSGHISPKSIAFIEETGQIWTHWTFFVPSKLEFSRLRDMVEEHDHIIKDILQGGGDEWRHRQPVRRIQLPCRVL